MENAKLIKGAEAIWDTICAPNWTKESLIEFGKLVFARQKFEKLDQPTKLLFIKAMVMADRAAFPTNGETKTEEVKTEVKVEEKTEEKVDAPVTENRSKGKKNQEKVVE